MLREMLALLHLLQAQYNRYTELIIALVCMEHNNLECEKKNVEILVIFNLL